MDETTLLLAGVFALLVLLLGGAVALSRIAYRSRHRIRLHRPQLEEIARQKGLRFSDAPDFVRSHPGLEQAYPVSLCADGSYEITANSLSGDLGGFPAVVAFLQLVSGSGKSRRDRYYTLLAAAVDERVPAFLLVRQPTGFEARVEALAARHLTPDDVAQAQRQIDLRKLEFPDHPEFARRFRVAGPQPGRIAALFRSEVVSHLAQRPADLVLSCAAGWLVVGVERHVPPAELDRFLAESGAIRDLLVLKD